MHIKNMEFLPPNTYIVSPTETAAAPSRFTFVRNKHMSTSKPQTEIKMLKTTDENIKDRHIFKKFDKGDSASNSIRVS